MSGSEGEGIQEGRNGRKDERRNCWRYAIYETRKKLKKKFHLDILLTFRNCMNPITFSIRNSEDMLASFSFTDFYRHQTDPRACSSQTSQILYLGSMILRCVEMHCAASWTSCCLLRDFQGLQVCIKCSSSTQLLTKAQRQ